MARSPGNASSDHAELSSVASVLRELTRRVEILAARYQGTPDSSVAAELFEAERALVTANRVIERTVSTLATL